MRKENTWFKTQTYEEFSKEFDRRKKIERVKENEASVVKQMYKDEVANSMYAFVVSLVLILILLIAKMVVIIGWK